ncbi:MAG: hypothetical protein H6830_07075 [Planctomycetes bacterium]|mgnify:CR=1 FL=1|nr:hypothetical protein [Planctomycetota bacterium]MCB9911462.1 hypothetical protein [Planctomycetota bacterium]HPF14808.1 hypothetical protein [Planctomycetota bacterium]
MFFEIAGPEPMQDVTPISGLCLLLLLGCVRPESASSASSSSVATLPSARSAAVDNRTPEERLQGTWVAKGVDVSMGEITIQWTFRNEGGMKLAAWSDTPFVGQVRDRKGSYEILGSVLSSQAIRGGTSVEF